MPLGAHEQRDQERFEVRNPQQIPYFINSTTTVFKSWPGGLHN